MIKEYLLRKALDATFDITKKVLRESGSKLLTTQSDIEESINYHLRSLKNWSGEVSFNDLRKAKRTSDIFIELDLFVYPRRMRIQSTETIASIPLTRMFDEGTSHFILLGGPGAGKTTSMKYLCQALFYDETFYSKRFSFPILVKFRDLNNIKNTADSLIIIDQVYSILGLKLHLPEELRKNEAAAERQAIREKLVINVLESLNVLLILDGFDELAHVTKRKDSIKQISNLATHLDSSTLIVTSRTGDFVYNIDNTVQYEISPLSKEQISTFATKWLRNEEKASDFLERIQDSPFADTTIRPLTLAHLCAIYERIGKIPEKPKTVYKKIVYLLLEEWDQQRSVRRDSRYAHFEVDRKFEFLCQLAYALTTSLQKTVFNHQELLKVYTQIFYDYDLDKSEARQVVSELESHTGLLLQSGYEEYEFAHKSLQEYLTAEYFVRLPAIPNDKKILSKLPNELAIAVTISSSPSDYFTELIINRLVRQKLSADFVKSFLNRLLLEKPDFNTSTKLGLSLVTLYTIYVEFNVVSGNQLKLFYVDTVINEFERVLKLALTRSSIEAIRFCYETDFVYKMDNGDDIHRMVQKPKRPIYSIPISPADLPKTIYIRTSLLSKDKGNRPR